MYFEDDRDVPNKLMVHCVGNSKHVIRSHTTSLLAKCLMIGEAVKNEVLDLPAPKEVHHHFILPWNRKEHLSDLVNDQFGDDKKHQCILKYQNQEFPNEESTGIYELGRELVHSIGQRSDLWLKLCAGWIWIHFNGQNADIMDREQVNDHAADRYKEKILNSEEAMHTVQQMYRQNLEMVQRLKRNSYMIVPKEKTADHIFWNFIGWIGTVPCDREQCHNQIRIHCECTTERDFLFHFVEQMVSVILKKSDNFMIKMLNNSLQVPKWGKSYDEVRQQDLHQLTLKQALQLICNRYFEGEHKDQYFRYLKEWISMELYNFECWHCGSTNKSIMVDRIYRYSQNMIYCMMCSRIQPGRRKNSRKERIVLNIDSIPTRYDAQDAVTDEAVSVFQSGNLMRYSVHSPKFKSFAEELLLNEVYHLNLSQWFECLERARRWLRQNQHTVQRRRSQIHDVKFGIFRGENVDIRHIVALYFFTEFPEYATAFIESHHGSPEEHCKSFYWMGRFLWEMNHFFGTALSAEKELYSVIANNSVFDSFAPSLCVPFQSVDDEEELDLDESTSRMLSLRAKYTKIGDIGIDETKYIETNEWTARQDDSEWFVIRFAQFSRYLIIKKFDNNLLSKQ